MATILIVDDNKKNLQVLGNILAENNYRVAMAIDGSKALELAPKLKPDIILLDIMMPGIDGFEVCRLMKSDATICDIPIIFLSAKVDLEDVVTGFNVGGVDYITKPFKKEELLVRIKTQLTLMEHRRKIEQQGIELFELNSFKDKVLESIGAGIKEAFSHFAKNAIGDKESHQVKSIDELIELLKELKSKTYHL
jgi:two-component system, sensor histidine kinase and response regulator